MGKRQVGCESEADFEVDWRAREDGALKRLEDAEALNEKKAKIYSKLLTEQALAADFEALAGRHGEGVGKLQRTLYGKKCKGEGDENEN